MTRVTPDKYGHLQRDTLTMRQVRQIPVSRSAGAGGASAPPRAKTGERRPIKLHEHRKPLTNPHV